MLELVSVITITLLAVISPGADFAMVSRNSMFLSRRAGLLTALGISLGVLVHVTYSMLGIGLLISQSILLFNLVKFAGAAYLIWLGIGMLRSRKLDPQQVVAAPQLSDWQALRVGFLTNALNPKTTLFVVALFTQVISPDTATLTQLGYGLGLAMGAKLARPDKLCINVWGDAAIGFTGMDFETAVRERIPILSILLNNFSMAIELPIMKVSTEKYRSTDISGNYAEMAKAFGGYGERVTSPAEIVPAIKRGIRKTQEGTPALLEFLTQKEIEFSMFK